jgi:AcrR family transcriptional regulator
MNSSHPTKVLLIQTTVALIKIRPMAEVTIDLVLSESGISKGSLYHHFADFADLIEQAEVAIFVDQADISLNDLQEILQKSHSREEFLSRIRTLTHRNMGRTNRISINSNPRHRNFFWSRAHGQGDGGGSTSQN